MSKLYGFFIKIEKKNRKIKIRIIYYNYLGHNPIEKFI